MNYATEVGGQERRGEKGKENSGAKRSAKPGHDRGEVRPKRHNVVAGERIKEIPDSARKTWGRNQHLSNRD